jgi:hypothetical protein
MENSSLRMQTFKISFYGWTELPELRHSVELRKPPFRESPSLVKME